MLGVRGKTALAKFPHSGDDVDVERWEAVALALAKRAGIPVPNWRIEEVAGCAVLLLHRFDREAGCRVPFLSAMSMLGADDNESGRSLTDARRIAGEVGFAVSQWRQEASRAGIERAEIDRMASAFEHDDLRQSLAANPP